MTDIHCKVGCSDFETQIHAVIYFYHFVFKWMETSMISERIHKKVKGANCTVNLSFNEL